MPVRATSAEVIPPLATTTSTAGRRSRTAVVSAVITFSPWASVLFSAVRTRSLVTTASGRASSCLRARRAAAWPASTGSARAAAVPMTAGSPQLARTRSSCAVAPPVCEPQARSAGRALATIGRGSSPVLATPASSAARGAAERTTMAVPALRAVRTASAMRRMSSPVAASGSSTLPAGAPANASARPEAGPCTTASGIVTGRRRDFSRT